MMVRMRILRFRSDGSSLPCIVSGGAIVDLTEKLPSVTGEGSEVPFPVRMVAPLEIVETLDFLAHDGLLLCRQGI
jgi:hypothetical protein